MLWKTEKTNARLAPNSYCESDQSVSSSGHCPEATALAGEDCNRKVMQAPKRASVRLLRPLLASTETLILKSRQSAGDTMALSRKRVQLVRVEDLEMSPRDARQTVKRLDKKLSDASYLTETLTPEQLRSVVLPARARKTLGTRSSPSSSHGL